jgi:hypothetical protein
LVFGGAGSAIVSGGQPTRRTTIFFRGAAEPFGHLPRRVVSCDRRDFRQISATFVKRKPHAAIVLLRFRFANPSKIREISTWRIEPGEKAYGVARSSCLSWRQRLSYSRTQVAGRCKSSAHRSTRDLGGSGSTRLPKGQRRRLVEFPCL